MTRITLRPEQAEAAGWLREAMKHPGEIKFTAVTGAGRSMVIAEACRGVEVAFISRMPVMLAQMKVIAERMGVHTMAFVKPEDYRPDLYPVAVLCESMRAYPVSATTVVRNL